MSAPTIRRLMLAFWPSASSTVVRVDLGQVYELAAMNPKKAVPFRAGLQGVEALVEHELAAPVSKDRVL